MQRLYQNVLKKGNGDQEYLICPDLRDNNFEVLCSEISLEKVDLYCAETVKAKTSGNDSGFITYSNRTNFSSKWLEKNVI